MINRHAHASVCLILVSVAALYLLSESSEMRAQSGGTAGGRAVRQSGGSRDGSDPRVLSMQPIDGVVELGAGIFRISDPRPLAAVAELLQRKFGVPVSYEEEVLQYSGDMVFASELPGNRELAIKTPGWKGPLVPRMGTLELSIPSTAVLKQIADPSEFILQAIKSHQQNKNVGGFKLVKVDGGGFSIVMDQMADKSGKIGSVVPALDSPVSFPEAERSLAETLALISKSVAAAGKPSFGCCNPGTEAFLENTKVKTGASNESARNVLARALRIPGSPLKAWNLSMLPGGYSILSLRTVSVEAVDSNGRVGLQLIFVAR